MIAHSRPAVAAYLDLVRLHLDERASSLVGTIEERHRSGRTYLYERFRIGTEMISRYLGEARPALRDRLERAGTEGGRASAQAADDQACQNA